MGLFTRIFGEPKQVDLPRFGTFQTRVRHLDQKDLIWKGSTEFDEAPVNLELEGDARGPLRRAVDDLIFILDHMEMLKKQALVLMESEEKLCHLFRDRDIAEFTLKSIKPFYKNRISYELFFDSDFKDESLGLTVINRRVVEVYFGDEFNNVLSRDFQ